MVTCPFGLKRLLSDVILLPPGSISIDDHLPEAIILVIQVIGMIAENVAIGKDLDLTSGIPVGVNLKPKGTYISPKTTFLWDGDSVILQCPPQVKSANGRFT